MISGDSTWHSPNPASCCKEKAEPTSSLFFTLRQTFWLFWNVALSAPLQQYFRVYHLIPRPLEPSLRNVFDVYAEYRADGVLTEHPEFPLDVADTPVTHRGRMALEPKSEMAGVAPPEETDAAFAAMVSNLDDTTKVRCWPNRVADIFFTSHSCAQKHHAVFRMAFRQQDRS